MNLLTPLAGFLIGYGGIMGYQVIDSTYKGEMPGPKSFGYFIGGMTLLSAATIYALGKTDKVFNAEEDNKIYYLITFNHINGEFETTSRTIITEKEAMKSDKDIISHEFGDDDPIDEGYKGYYSIHDGEWVRVDSKKSMSKERKKMFNDYGLYAESFSAEGNYNDFIEDMEGVMGKYGEMKDFDSGYNPQDNLLKARMVVEVDDEDFDNVDFDAEMMMPEKQCVICGGPYTGYGHNPEPIFPMSRGRCCDVCNATVVIPYRLGGMNFRFGEDFEAETFRKFRNRFDIKQTGNRSSRAATGVKRGIWKNFFRKDAEAETARVRTMSGKPVSETLRKLKQDKNLSAKDARTRKEIKAENVEVFEAPLPPICKNCSLSEAGPHQLDPTGETGICVICTFNKKMNLGAENMEVFEAPKTMTKLQAKRKVIALMKPYWLKQLKNKRGPKISRKQYIAKYNDEWYEANMEDWDWWDYHVETVQTGKYAAADTGGDTILREALPHSYWAFINEINPTWEGSEKYDDEPYETMYLDIDFCIYDRTTPWSEWSASDKRKLNKLEKRWEEEEDMDFFDYIDQKEAIEGKYNKTVQHKSQASKMNCKHCGPYFKNRANINTWDILSVVEDPCNFFDYWEYPASLKKQVKALIPALKGIKPKPKARAKKATTKPKAKVAKKTTTRKAKPKAKAGRKSPTLSATRRKIGTRMRGNDGKMYEVKKSGKSQRWMAGAETMEVFEAPKTMTKSQAKNKFLAILKPYWLKALKNQRGPKLTHKQYLATIDDPDDDYYGMYEGDWDWWNNHVKTVQSGAYGPASPSGDTILRERLPMSYYDFINNIAGAIPDELEEKYSYDNGYDTLNIYYGACILNGEPDYDDFSAADKRKYNSSEDEKVLDAIWKKYDKQVTHRTASSAAKCRHCGPYINAMNNTNNWDWKFLEYDDFWNECKNEKIPVRELKSLTNIILGKAKPQPKPKAKKTTTRKAKPKAKTGRKSPTLSATRRKIGTRMRGNDGKMYEVKKSGKSQRWMAGAETFEAEALARGYKWKGIKWTPEEEATLSQEEKEVIAEQLYNDWKEDLNS